MSFIFRYGGDFNIDVYTLIIAFHKKAKFDQWHLQ